MEMEKPFFFLNICKFSLDYTNHIIEVITLDIMPKLVSKVRDRQTFIFGLFTVYMSIMTSQHMIMPSKTSVTAGDVMTTTSKIRATNSGH